MASPQVAGYGTWKSPISSSAVTKSGVTLQMLCTDGDPNFSDTVYWNEIHSDEGGRYVVCSTDASGNITQWTPQDFNSRTTVHEYGGADFFVYQGVVYFSNFTDQVLYRQTSPTSAPEAIVDASKKYRYADGQYSPKKSRIYCVREDHEEVPGKTEAQNTIVAINPETKTQTVVASGADFYGCPSVSPDGKKITWVQWYHPNMPWDTTEIWTAELSDSGDGVVEGTAAKVVGGKDESGQELSVILPSWTSNNELLYIGDQSDWWNLYLVKGSRHENLRPVSQEIGGPQWQFTRSAYAFVPNTSRLVTTFAGELGYLDIETKAYEKIETGLKSNVAVAVTGAGTIYCLSHSAKDFPQILRLDGNTKQVQVLHVSMRPPVDSGYFSSFQKLSWPTGKDEVSHGLYYPPQNKDFVAPEGELPPVLVKAHGGPTSQFKTSLNLQIQYFTSRGFAVLCVDYRGSTGYGKAYRHKLRSKWGVLDIEDCCSGVDYLVAQKLADPKRLCIDGGSAGGYTTLACLTFTDTFTCGVSHYGISDLLALVQETHKFESRYTDNLLCPVGVDDNKLLKERSPINYPERINCPMGFFQGDEDKIVPPNQAQMMYEAVKAKGLPAMFVLFEGEQHGFRKAENIQKALDGEFYFFSKVFGFEAADKGIEVPIDNL